MNKLPIYLDYNASTPLDPDVSAVMLRHLSPDSFGNPSSSHQYGVVAQKIVSASRRLVADSLHCAAEQIIFTSGATGRLTILLSSIEHVASEAIASYLQEFFDIDVYYCPVTHEGIINIEAFQCALEKNQNTICFVSIIHANAEIGSIQPIKKLVQLTKSFCPNALFHCDASQSFGKINVDVNQLDVDLLTIAGHKIYAPKGIGCLYIKDKLKIIPLQQGGGQEGGLRGGTENVMLIEALGRACQIVAQQAKINEMSIKPTSDIFCESSMSTFHYMRQMRHLLQKELLIQCENNGIDVNSRIYFNGPENEEYRLPNTLSISFYGLCGKDIVDAVKDSVAFSSGSACHSNTTALSGTLAACGLDPLFGKGTIRLSTGRLTTEQEIFLAAKLISIKVAELYKLKGLINTKSVL